MIDRTGGGRTRSGERQNNAKSRFDPISARIRAGQLLADPSRAVFVAGAAGLLSLALAGLPLAIAGVFNPWLVGPATVALWIVLTRFALSSTVAVTNTRGGKTASCLALVIAASFAAFATAHSGEHLLTDRDPGVYFVTGKWLAVNGDLLLTTGLPSDVNEAFPPIWPMGTYGRPDHSAYFQFQHTPAVIMATAQWAGGDWLMFRIMGLVGGIGILGVYLLGRTLIGPVIALAPLVAAATHPVFIHVGKDGYSEPLTLVFTMAAFWYWLAIREGSGPRSYFVAGLLLGAPTLARIDGWLPAIGFLAGLTYMVVTHEGTSNPTRRKILALATGFVFTSGLGLLDLMVRSPVYLRDLSGSAFPMMVTAVAVLVATAAASVPLVPRVGALTRRLIAPAGATFVLLAGIYGLFIRPRTTVTLGDPIALVAGLQTREGLLVDPARSYAEMSLEWIARYQGHIPVAFGIAAISLVVLLVLRERGNRAVPVLVALLVTGTIYFWRPSITPDHLWAMRRFVPVVLPLSFVFAALGAQILVRRAKRPELATPGVAIILTLALTQALVVGWPVAAVRTQAGVGGAAGEVCSMIPPNGALVVSERASVIAAAVRTTCLLPVTVNDDPLVLAAIQSAGLIPISASSAPRCDGATIGKSSVQFEFPERTLSFSPRGPEQELLVVYVADATATVAPTQWLDSPFPEALLAVEVSTTWTPDRWAVIASIGNYGEGMWIQYGESGDVSVWVTTELGFIGVPVPAHINNGASQVVGGYVADGVLHAICGDQITGSAVLPAPLSLVDHDLNVAPEILAEDFEVFLGDVNVIASHSGFELEGARYR